MKHVRQINQKEIERIDALFREIGAGEFTPVPLREARETLSQPIERSEFAFSDVCQKTIYPSEHAAQKVLRFRQSRGAGKLRVYKCELCHAFHLSSFFGKL